MIEVPKPKLGGTFIHCPICKFKTRRLRKYRRHWRNMHGPNS